MKDWEISGKLQNLCCFECIFFAKFVRPILLQVRELVPGLTISNIITQNGKGKEMTNFLGFPGLTVSNVNTKWQKERNHKFLRLPGLSYKATAIKMAKM